MKRGSEDEEERLKTRHIDAPLGAKLRRARDALPLSREAMADYLSVSVSTIQRYENGGQRIPASRLWQMCRRLNIEVGRLFEGLPYHVAPVEGFAEPPTVFDHDDGRAKVLDALSKAAGGLATDRLEIAVEVVKALRARHS